MLDEQGMQTFSREIHTLWIQPELDRRFSETGIPAGFQIRQALIKMPHNQPAIVEFNDEVHWAAENPKLAGGRTIADIDIGEPIYLHELISIDNVLPPFVDDKRVAFVYLFWSGHSYSVVFDFSPNDPDFKPENDNFELGKAIGEHMSNVFKELAVKNAQFAATQLRAIGLWPVTSLLPYPISKIVERVGSSDPEGARKVLVDYCDIEFLTQKVVRTWSPVVAFKQGLPFFEAALSTHQRKQYHGSVSILVGQIEGVITDWLLEVKYYTSDEKRSLKKKIQDLRDAFQQIPDLLWTYRESRDVVIDFLEHGPLLQQFNSWFQSIDTSFPGRHVVQHGKRDKDVYTEENSVKLFLLLDTICQFMMFYEVRVLGRDLGQNAGSNPS